MTDFWAPWPDLARRLVEVREAMRDVVRSGRFPLAGQVERLIVADGKMIRPAFLLMAAGFGRKPREESDLVSLAAAVELLHVATLVHDDVIDEAATRRGVPTLHAACGVKNAVLAGDWLLSRAFNLASGVSSPGNARLLAALVGAICAEEIHQDLERFAWPDSVRNYLRKIAGKTAAMFALALRAGAVETGAGPRTVALLTRTGYDTGMAFQIMDDVLDYESTEGAMRKPVGRDLREGLCTLPLVLALRTADTGVRPLLGPGRPDDATVAAVTAAVKASGALDASRAMAASYTGRAMAEIRRLPAVPARAVLADVVDRLLSRSN